MQTITHYEVYQAGLGQWTMAARFTGNERDIAVAHARGIEEDFKRPVAVIEEIEDLASAQFDVRLIHRSLTTGADIRVPQNQSDLGSRIFMIALNGLAIGAITVVLGAVALSRAGLGTGTFNLALLGIFLGSSVLGGLLLFRIYIPVGVILWRAKDPESRKRTILALGQGRVVSPVPDHVEPEIAPVRMETAAADGFQSAPGLAAMADAADAPPPPELHSEATAQPGPAPETPPEAPAADVPSPDTPPAPVATASETPAPATLSDEVLTAVVERTKGMLNMFADEGVATLRPTRPVLTPVDRLGFSLYLLGAAQAAAERNALDAAVTRMLAEAALARSRLSPEEIAAFFADLEINGERPRYRNMVEQGKTAIGLMLGDASGPRALLTEILAKWSDPLNQAGEPQQVTFLLTDIVGSTALTSEIGNAGAQRVVRAHNAICRAATKAFRGREVKHTGDGMLMIFPDSTAGARAAIDIQQEGRIFALDNPTAPLSMRIGVHTGEAVFEDGEYFGPAVAAVNGITAVANGGEICCSAAVRQRLPTLLKAEEIDTRSVKGSATPIQLFRVLWEPKRAAAGKPVLEYRQIGTTPSAPAATAPVGSERR